MMNYSELLNSKVTPQSQPIPGSNQVPNSAGGYAWQVDQWTRLERFLILGSEGGSYYASGRELTIENAQNVIACVKSDGIRTVETIRRISEAGRAPKNDPAIFALGLALTYGSATTKSVVRAVVHEVVRTGTHLFGFVKTLNDLRGWGRAAQRAVRSWYMSQTPDELAYQVAKYRNRHGFTHRDVLRLVHLKSSTLQPVLRWAVKGEQSEEAPRILAAVDRMAGATDVKDILEVIDLYPKSITHEMVPSTFLGDPKVWEHLLPHMPMTATIRNLARMTANGLLKPLGLHVQTVVAKLSNEEVIKKARVHPLSVLVALKTYAQGASVKSSLTWEPVPAIVDALDGAFYKAFQNVEPSGKRILLAVDVSGSMTWSEIAGMPGITPRVGAAALSLVTAATEPHTHIVAFSHEMVPVKLSPKNTLEQTIETFSAIPLGGTDASLPMLWAAENGIEVDAFVVLTDNETWSGDIHPSQALQQYRKATGIPAKLVVVGMVANEISIADPQDAGMLDVVGFDTATPALISDFIKN